MGNPYLWNFPASRTHDGLHGACRQGTMQIEPGSYELLVGDVQRPLTRPFTVVGNSPIQLEP